jgi:aldose 1-epimerase
MEIECGVQRFRWAPEVGGRLVSWIVDGIELLGKAGDHPVEFGMYAMAPWSGRIQDNAIRVQDMEPFGVKLPTDYHAEINYQMWALHGTCFTDPVDRVEVSGNAVRMHQKIPRWPWEAELMTVWTLLENGLEIDLVVQSEEPSPAIVGWHPWFQKTLRGSQARWSMDSASMAVRDGAFAMGEWVPLSETSGPYDDAFHSPNHTATIHWPHVISLSIHSSQPWFVVFDERSDVMCVEPQSNIPNPFAASVAAEGDFASAEASVSLLTRWEWSLGNP